MNNYETLLERFNPNDAIIVNKEISLPTGEKVSSSEGNFLDIIGKVLELRSKNNEKGE